MDPVNGPPRASPERATPSADDVLDLDHYRFRGLHPLVRFGTASDRYAGWLGQIYTPERYEGRIQAREKRLGGHRFTERVLPVDCVEEYFGHFRVLEIDFTFYGPLLDAAGKATSNYRVLGQYVSHLPPGGKLLLKAPQAFFARKLRRGKSFVENPQYLDARAYARQFHEPARALLGDALHGVIFEQEYQTQAERQAPGQLAADLDRFLRALPEDDRYHVELRTETYLSEPVFPVLEARGVGQVLSHWTWLPFLRAQFRRSGERFLNRGKRCVVRLMTPRKLRYQDAYAKAHPFDRMVDGMASPGMVEDTVHLMQVAVDRRVEINVIVNNRAGGNAPMIAREVAAAYLAASAGETHFGPGKHG